MSHNTYIVIIEDETAQQDSLREALLNAQFSQDVTLLPRGGAKAYASMEAFVQTPEGRDRELQAIIIADLFLAEVTKRRSGGWFPMQTDPVSSFQQLMYTLYKSPTDFAVVCGRLGVLHKMVNYYRLAHVEVYTYYPTYFATYNKALIVPDEYLYTNIKRSDIKDYAKRYPTEFAEFMHARNLAPDDDGTGIEMLQCLALRDALDERINGIFKGDDIMTHVTDGPARGGSRLATSTSVKAEELDHSKLIAKINTMLQQGLA